MRISEASAETGLSADTIRFYHREGLLGDLRRSAEGHRLFGPDDLRRLRLFERLKSTSMPLDEMKRYAALARAGEATLAERQEMLRRHRSRLDDQQDRIAKCRALIDEKLALYGDLIAGA